MALAGILVWTLLQLAGRWYVGDGDVAAGAEPLIAATAPALPDDGGPFPGGTAEQAQHEVRLAAVAFADCVFRAGGAGRLADAQAPPYEACLRSSSLGLVDGSITRRGSHGPIDGRGARDEFGVFTVHGGREAFLLQYDDAGRGWGFSFDGYGEVAPECRTAKGRECWFAEDERPGALFLGDSETARVLAATLRLGRAQG